MSNTERHLQCPMRTALGNCDPLGGFCTSVNEPICKAFHRLYKPQGDWIPCIERLPDTNDKVLVTMIENEYGDTKVYFGSYVKSIQLWMVEDRASYFTHVEVIAWMPLPEPYKQESKDKR